MHRPPLQYAAGVWSCPGVERWRRWLAAVRGEPGEPRRQALAPAGAGAATAAVLFLRASVTDFGSR